MLTPFSDAAVKKYAPAVDPKKLLAPGEADDPNAPQDQPIKASAPTLDGPPIYAPPDGPGTYSDPTGPLGSPPVADAPKPTPAPTGPAEPIALGDPNAPAPTPTKPPATPTGPAEPAPQVLTPAQFPPTIDLGKADQDAPEPSKPGYVWHHNGHAWELRPAGSAGASTPGATPPATPTDPAASAAPAVPALSPAQFPPTIDLGKANQDAPEPSKPGYVWHHDGHGWGLIPAGQAGAAGAPGATPPAPTLEETLNQKLMSVLKQNEVPDRNDPAIAAALAANRLSEQRGTERARAMLAERTAREGGGADSGGLRTTLLGLNEGRSAREGQYAADTIMQETVQRRNQLQAVLALTGNMLDAKEKNRIQEELGKLNAEVDRYGISEGGRQFDANLAEQIRQFGIDDAFRRMGLDASNANAGASRSESARQFDINQAQQQAQWEADYNYKAYMDLLNYAMQYGGA